MKKIILLAFFALFYLNSKAQTFDALSIETECNVPPGCQEEPLCTYIDNCFKVDYFGATDLGNGTSRLKFMITNYSESTFMQAGFELPGVGAATNPAILPIANFRNRYNHNVINPQNDSMLIFNARNAGTFSYGGFEVYYYVVNNADLYAPSGRFVTVTAHAGRSWQQQWHGTVVVDLDDCEGVGPDSACITQESENFILKFPFYTSDIDGNDPLYFTIINKGLDDIEFVEIDATISALEPLDATIYNSPFNLPPYSYDVSNASPVVFTRTVAPPSTIGYNNGAQDVFNFKVNSLDFFNSGSLITVRVRAGAEEDTFFFECEECGDFLAPLPVNLTSFTGTLTEEGQVQLNWQTASEKNNSHFEIERSGNGSDFTKIGEIKGAGTTNATTNYSFKDKYIGSSTYYYRLRQVDHDGTAEYSKIIAIKQGNEAVSLHIKMLPNPCENGDCTIQLSNAGNAAEALIEIHDLTGKLIHSQQVKGAGQEHLLQLQELNLGKGIYILSAQSGNERSIERVVIQ